MGKSSRDKRDIFYRLAKEQGWRARSAYKLLQIDDEFNILAKDHNGNPLTRVVDLCAAPGSWSQVLSKRIWEPRSEVDRKDVKIVAVDLQAMAPIPGIIQLQGDITSRETADRVIQQFEGKKAQLVVCDGAPDVTGLHDLDEYVQSHLVLAALTICARILENGGTFVAKVFRGREAGLLGAQLRCLFSGDVVFAKPSSSRNSSLESFVVCRDFRGDSILPPSLISTATVESISNDNSVDSLMGWLNGFDQLNREQRIILPFVACGDLSSYDADSCYELGDDYTPHEPVQPPISAAYLDVCRKARTAAVNVTSSETSGISNLQTEGEDQTLSRLMEAAKISKPATAAGDKSRAEIEKAELEALMPTRRERQWFHSIALFYFLVGVVIGLPLWWYTTSPEQHALPTEKIGAIASQAITVGIDVAVLSLDPKLPKEDIDSLKQSLYFNAADAQRSLDAQHQVVAAASGRDSETRRYTALPVRVDYRFYVSDASGQVSKDVLAKGVSSDLDHTLVNSDLFVHLGGDKSSAVRHNVESAYYFVILPSGSKGLENESIKLDAVVRATTERNIIYLRSLPTEKMTSIILGILQEQLVKPPTLQAIYASVWWKGSDTEISMPSTTSNSTLVDYASARAEVAKLRTYQLPAAPGYEITVTLVSPYNVEPPSPPCLPSTDDWMWGPGNVSNLSFGEWLQRYVNPGLGDLKRFLNLNLYSQYLYSVMLDALEWSKLSKDRTHRFYTSAQLSNVLNSLEAYLGQHASERTLSNETNGGLHLVVVVDTSTREYNATKRKPLRFHISGSSRADPPSSIALVPQWGAFISLDDVDISLGNLGGVLVNTIRSFVGLSVRSQDIVSVGRGGSKILLESGSVNGMVVKWELDLWLRRRAIESLSTAALTLTSLVSTIERVPTMVINFEVANRVKSAVSAWSEAVSELASPPSASSKNPGARAFISARIALENADAAFFDHSLLDLLYFPSDQIFGIYVPLFAPIGLPLVASGVAALKFFLKKGAK